MKFNQSAELAAPPQAVAAAMADPETAKRAIPAGMTIAVTAETEGDPAASFTLSVRRTVAAADLPSQVRFLMSGGLDMREVSAWEAPAADGGRRGTLAVDVSGVPAHLSGSQTLEPLPDGGTRYSVDAELRTGIPFFGAKVEQVAAPYLAKALDAEVAALRATLAER